MMNNLQIDFELNNPEENGDILVAELAELGFDGFENTDTGLKAYLPDKYFNENAIRELIIKYAFIEDYLVVRLPEINWNSKWEASYEPITFEDQCIIMAPFHKQNPRFLYHVIVEPKMAFGTGHHDTTYLMVKHLLDEDLNFCSVLDMGCGTGVLSILAELKGAKPVWAIDNDEWAFNNTVNNCLLNTSEHVSVRLGNAKNIPDRKFNFILANINKNILKDDLSIYVKHLENNGKLLLSGFFEVDVPEMKAAAEKEGLRMLLSEVKNEWALLKFSLT